MNLFLETCPTKKIIGVTGSKGKGTTASLVAAILKQAGQSVFIGGNIGIAPFSFWNQLKAKSYVVLELSSFQLEDLKMSPRYSILTNLFHEHLEPADPNNPNFHHSFAAYKKAKLNIARWPQNQYFLVPEKLRRSITGQHVAYFSSAGYPSQLAGEFNKENIAAAAALARHLKITEATIKKAVAAFHGLPHRLELVTVKKGVTYYDNSFSTTPESTLADLKSLKNIILLLGGADKGADFLPLAKTAVKTVKWIILFKGTASSRIKTALLSAGWDKRRLSEASSMEQAVAIAKQKAETGDTVLLSTACASFGLFNNYKERGDLFQKYAKER